ncbi:MAG: class II glutamine amidotransferase, partial [Polyangiaceae bacterium]|nr:class II glutamine amidotransferase [Polyangiaceae bacterium]
FESLPQFLQRNVRGETDSELVFHLFLSFLHDAGKLDHPTPSPADCVPALRSAIGLLDRMSRDESLRTSSLNLVLGTPEFLVAMHRGAPMAYRVFRGREDFEPMFEDRGPGKLRMPDLEPCRLAIVASDFDGDDVPDGWTAAPERAIVTLTRTDEPAVLLP